MWGLIAKGRIVKRRKGKETDNSSLSRIGYFFRNRYRQSMHIKSIMATIKKPLCNGTKRITA